MAFLLEALGQPWEPVFVDYMQGGQTRQADWREEVNAMGEAPVLEADGQAPGAVRRDEPYALLPGERVMPRR